MMAKKTMFKTNDYGAGIIGLGTLSSFCYHHHHDKICRALLQCELMHYTVQAKFTMAAVSINAISALCCVW